MLIVYMINDNVLMISISIIKHSQKREININLRNLSKRQRIYICIWMMTKLRSVRSSNSMLTNNEWERYRGLLLSKSWKSLMYEGEFEVREAVLNATYALEMPSPYVCEMEPKNNKRKKSNFKWNSSNRNPIIWRFRINHTTEISSRLKFNMERRSSILTSASLAHLTS